MRYGVDQVGVSELRSRDVHSDTNRFGPFHGGLTRTVQGPCADLVDEVGFLGNRHENVGADKSPLRMFPPHQRFKCNHHIIFGTNDRLIMKFEQIVRQRFPQAFFKQAPLGRFVFQVGGIKTELSAPAIFRSIKREVSIVDEIKLLDSVIRRDCDTD